MNHKILSVFLGTILLVSLVSIPAFAQLASIAPADAVDDTASLNLEGAVSVEIVTINGTPYAVIAADVDDGIQILNLSDPTNVTASGQATDGATFTRLDGAKDVDSFTVGSSTLVIVTANDESAIQIIDITDPDNPVARGTAVDDGTFTELGGAWGVTTFTVASAPHALVTGFSDAGAVIINLADPDNPVVTDTIQDNAGGITRLTSPTFPKSFVIGSTTYVAIPSFGESAIQIVDVSDPTDVTAVANPPTDTSVDAGSDFDHLGGVFNLEIFTLNNRTYVIGSAFSDDAIEIIDITTPSAPDAVTGGFVPDTGNILLDGPEGVSAFTLGDSTYIIVNAYAEDSSPEDGFQIFDISNINHPIPIFQRSDDVDGFTELDNAHDVETVIISGTTYAVIASDNVGDGVQVVTFKTPVTGGDTGDFIQLIDDSDSTGTSFANLSTFDLGINSTNHIFVAENTNNRIPKFNSTGIFLSALTTNVNSPHDIVHDSNNRIIVSSDSGGDTNVRIFSSTGTSVDTITGAETGATAFVFPHGLAVDSSDNIYIVDRDASVSGSTGILQKFSSAGAHLLTLSGNEAGATLFNEPLGVAVDSNGRIIVTQRGGSTDGFQIFDSSGNFVKRVTIAATSGDTAFDNPHDVAVDASDRIYVADENNDRVQIFNSAGTFLQSLTTAAGTALNNPSGIAIDSNGRIVVADSFNNRIVVFQGFGVKIADTEGSSKTVTVEIAGDAASFQYQETEDDTTETVSLNVGLPDNTTGNVTVETVDEDTVEDGVQLATAADIDAPCTNTCTVQFTVPNSVLTELGLSPELASIYHDTSGNEILEADEAITTSRDTNAVADSTVFTGSASFTSKFAVGGVVSTTTAQATVGAAAAFGLFGLIDTCNENGFGDGQSLMVYDIMYDKCDEQQVKVYADTTCGPMTVKIGDAYGISIAGMSSNQPLLNNATKKVIYNHSIESDMEWFSVIITDKKDEFTDKIYTNQCTGTMSFTGNTGYTSEQQGTNSQSDEGEITESSAPPKLILPGDVVEVIPVTSDSINEVFNTIVNSELETDPEPIIPDVDSFSPKLLIDPEPQELEIDPEPIDVSLWLQSFTEFWKIFIR